MQFRLSIICVIAATLIGCSAMTPGSFNSVEPVTNEPRVGNAYLLRGFIGVFSTGIDHLGTEVNAAGIHGEVFQDDQWSDLADQIAQRFHGHPEAEPLVLIGHSYGADDVIRIARKLDAVDVPVNLLITLDPVTPPAVPKNVRMCVNIYQSNGLWDNLPFLRGIPLEQEPGSLGMLFNENIRTERTDLLDPDVNHFNIEKKQKVHDEVMRLLLAVCPTRQDWLAEVQASRLHFASAAKVRPAAPATLAPPPTPPLATYTSARDLSN